MDSSLIANTWEQLHQAVGHGVTRLWMANVGDFKGNELPLQFFLDYAWNPDNWPVDRLSEWERGFAAQSFGAQHAADIATVLHTYGRLQSRRKPELLNRHITVDPTKDITTDPSAVIYDDQATPFSLTDYQELDTITAQWQDLATQAERIGRTLPAQYQDAYYELVLYQVKATANLYALRQAEFTNIHYASQGRSATNDLATVAEARFADDLALATFYNTKLANGKWQGFQLQPHIDYGDVARYGPNAPWQQPELNNVALPDVIFPAVQRIQVPPGADFGVAIDGSDQWWPSTSGPALLPVFSPYQSQPAQYIEIFNRGQAAFDYRIRSGAPWVVVRPNQGRVDKQVRAIVRVDWSRAPKGTSQVPLTVTGPSGQAIVVTAVVHNTGVPAGSPGSFVEANGYVSIEADHFTRAVDTGSLRWQRIPDIGRTGAGMTPFPVTAPSQTPGGPGPRLEYGMTLFTTGPVTAWAYLSPRNNVLPTDGLRYAVSMDNEAPQVVNITTATGANDTTMNRQWERNTSENVNRTATTHLISRPGAHVLKFWMVDPTVVGGPHDPGGQFPQYPDQRRAHRPRRVRERPIRHHRNAIGRATHVRRRYPLLPRCAARPRRTRRSTADPGPAAPQPAEPGPTLGLNARSPCPSGSARHRPVPRHECREPRISADQGQLPYTDRVMTNKELLRHVYTEVSRGDAAPLLAALADDVRWTIIGSTPLSGTFQGKQEVLDKLLKPLTARLTGPIVFTFDRFIAEGDHVVMIAGAEATAVTGRPYNNVYCIVCRFADGKIQEMTDYVDTELITRALFD